MRTLSERLRAIIPGLAERIHEQIIDTGEQHGIQDALSVEIRRRNILASLESIFSGLATGRLPLDEAPTTAIEIARISARSGVQLESLIRAYGIGHSLTWDTIMEEVDSLFGNRPERLAILRLSSRFLFDWNHRVTTQLTGAYQREYGRRYRDRDREKRALILELLEGMPVDTASLRYSLHGEHVALVAWDGDPGDAVRDLAESLDASLLTMPGTGGSLYAWLGGDSLQRHNFPDGPISRVAAGTRLAIGRRFSGVEGFRRSYRQASRAHEVALRMTTPVVRYQDVALEALAGGDRHRLREFVENELQPIMTDDERDGILRETLSAYFRTGQNAASAGPLLGIHERTVAYRLRSVETRLGYPIQDRSDELAVALRLFPLIDLLGGPEARPPQLDPIDG